MEVAALVGLVAQLMPLATSLVGQLSAANAIPKKSNDIVQFIGSVTPIARDLVFQLENIRKQTEADHAAIWDGIRDDWNATVAKWNGNHF